MRPRFTIRSLAAAVAILAFLFAALRYDVGRLGYLLFVCSCLAFGSAAAVASKATGRARAAALAAASLSCLAGLAVFLVLGRR